jgi:hypothetical protein
MARLHPPLQDSKKAFCKSTHGKFIPISFVGQGKDGKSGMQSTKTPAVIGSLSAEAPVAGINHSKLKAQLCAVKIPIRRTEDKCAKEVQVMKRIQGLRWPNFAFRSAAGSC